jgi:integrase
MARQIERLSALAVSRAKQPGMYADGRGLYLQVTSSGAQSWVYRFMLSGRVRDMGLGPVNVVSLSEARARASQCRRLRLDGIDPIEARKAERTRAQLDAAKSLTFDECSRQYIEAHKAGWRSGKHALQWTSTLATYVGPVFGSLPVQSIDVGLVMRCLEPIWATKPETAGRVRGRVEAILDWATVRSYRQGENPARWRGHLESLLPRRSKVARVEHHPALAYAEVGEFMAKLRGQEGIAAWALEFVILTAARTGEVIGARWDEIDLSKATWTIPANRMKGGREHRVPLSDAAVAIIEAMKAIPHGDFVFPGMRAGKPLSNMAILVLLRRMKRDDLTAHGFRSSFRDWAAEQSAFPSEVVEMALAHAVGSKVEAAYRRGDLYQKRQRLMDEWAGYCSAPTKAGQVVPMRRKGE